MSDNAELDDGRVKNERKPDHIPERRHIVTVIPHWKMREYMSEFRLDDNEPNARRDARLPVLMTLMLHANHRMRCWPSTEMLCKETGFETAAVVEARKWLIAKQAIYLVAYDKRVGAELKLPKRQFVYQLTGVIMTSTGMQPYSVQTPEAESEAIQEVSEVSQSKTSESPKVSVTKTSPAAEVSHTEVSVSEISVSETKGIKDSKDLTISEDKPEDSSSESVSQPARVEPAAGDDDEGFIRTAAKRFALFEENEVKLLALPDVEAVALMLEAKRQARTGDGGGLLASMLRTDTGKTDEALRLAPLAIELEMLNWPELVREERAREFAQLHQETADIAARKDGETPEGDQEPDGLDQILVEGERGGLTPREVWAAAKGQLSLQLNRGTWSSWVQPVRVIRYADGVLTLRAPSVTARDFLNGRMRPALERAVRLVPELVELRIEVVA